VRDLKEKQKGEIPINSYYLQFRGCLISPVIGGGTAPRPPTPTTLEHIRIFAVAGVFEWQATEMS
jgi:hypothetical protein